jgi:hypothetical protein
MLFSTNKKKSIGKTLISMTICIVMIATAFSVTNSKAASVNNPTYNADNPLCYTFTFKEPTVQEKTVLNNVYSTIDMAGCIGLGKDAGAPTMPVKFVQMMLPPMTTVDSIVATGTPVKVQLRGVDLTTTPIFPYQNEVPLNDPLPEQLVINNDLYASSTPYPTETINSFDIGFSHGYAIVSFSLNPMQYTPKTGVLYYYPEMTVTINLHATGEVNRFLANNPEDAKYVQSLVSNPEMASFYNGLPTSNYPGGICNSRDHYDYVIITTTQGGLDHWDIGGTLTYNWDSLLAAHAAEGLTGTVVTVQDINANSAYWNTSSSMFNDTEAHIRNFCTDAYLDWGTRYVLIGADAPQITARQLSYSYEGPVDSDLYYTNLDKTFNQDHDSEWGEEGDLGFDLYSELYIGRIVADEPQDVSNWLTKNFFYMDSTDFNYLENAAFYGGDSTWDCQGDDFVNFGAVKTTTDYLGPIPDDHGAYPAWMGMQYGFETWNATSPGNLYNLSVKWSGAPNPEPGWSHGDEIGGLRNDINADHVTLLSAFAHANNQMSCDVMDTEWEANYHNTMPFFVSDMGCHCGDFNDGDGILETMLFHSSVELAFACTYNTGYGWGSFEDTNSSSAIQMKNFWDYFFDVVNNSQSQSEWQFGKGQAWSKDAAAPTLNWTYSAAPGSYRGVIECCLFFGDPALRVKTPSPSDPPAKPSTPVGKTLGIWHVEYTYTSSTTDPNGDQIYYLYDWGDGTTSGWLGPFTSGQTVAGNHIWDQLGTYPVRVRARDVWGAGSGWSDPLQVTITDNTPPDVPTITGPHNGQPGSEYLFNFQTQDGQDQDVYFFVDWGDNQTTGWLGPYVSGTTLHLRHTWDAKMNCTIKAKAKDTMDSESEWGYFIFSTPTIFNPLGTTFLNWLFTHFPHAFPILRHLLGYS